VNIERFELKADGVHQMVSQDRDEQMRADPIGFGVKDRT
jgi:hypothetical protein